MTESLKNMLCAAKDVDEAGAILAAHSDEISTEDQRKMYEMVTGKTELTDEELDMIVGGSWFSDAWSSVKSWVSEHKTALIIAACCLAGAAVGMTLAVSALGFTGIATAASMTTLELVSTIGAAGMVGGVAGAAMAVPDDEDDSTTATASS